MIGGVSEDHESLGPEVLNRVPAGLIDQATGQPSPAVVGVRLNALIAGQSGAITDDAETRSHAAIYKRSEPRAVPALDNSSRLVQVTPGKESLCLVYVCVVDCHPELQSLLPILVALQPANLRPDGRWMVQGRCGEHGGDVGANVEAHQCLAVGARAIGAVDAIRPMRGPGKLGFEQAGPPVDV